TAPPLVLRALPDQPFRLRGKGVSGVVRGISFRRVLTMGLAVKGVRKRVRRVPDTRNRWRLSRSLRQQKRAVAALHHILCRQFLDFRRSGFFSTSNATWVVGSPGRKGGSRCASKIEKWRTGFDGGEISACVARVLEAAACPRCDWRPLAPD